MRYLAVFAAVLVSHAVCAATVTTIYSGASGNSSNDTWNNAANWSNGVPFGNADAVISDGKAASVVTPPTYSGSLTISSNATLIISGQARRKALGQSVIMGEGSTLYFHNLQGNDIDVPIALTGDAEISIGIAKDNTSLVDFSQPITGSHALSIGGNNNSRAILLANNTFASITTLGNRLAWGNDDENFVLVGGAEGSLGTGDITIAATDSLYLTSATFGNAIADTATLRLIGSASSKIAGKLVMGSDETIGQLIVDGEEMDPGDYNNSSSFLSGSGVLTVTGVTEIPEPGSMALLALGGVLIARRRRI